MSDIRCQVIYQIKKPDHHIRFFDFSLLLFISELKLVSLSSSRYEREANQLQLLVRMCGKPCIQ
jgi:hypothetical protein